MCLAFFFQAEDGIRDYKVTGVQTCALPISHSPRARSRGCLNRQAERSSFRRTLFRSSELKSEPMGIHRKRKGWLGETMSTKGNGGQETAAAKTDSGSGVAPATGKLGVMVVGMGAVATTMIAGVEAVRRGLAKPIGSLTQMGTIRLGKRTENRTPYVKDFVPLADLNDLVFTGWDIFEDNVYESAAHAKVLDKETLEQLRPYLETIKPMPAVFDQYYVKRLNGTHVKKGKNKRDLADQVIADIQNFKKTVDRVVMIWCASTEIFLEPTAVH